MRLVSFVDAGTPRYGIVAGTKVIDASARLGRRYATLRELFAADAVDELTRIAASEEGTLPLAALAYALPVPDAEKILCIGRNYPAHHELRSATRPEWPSVFGRFASSFSAHRQAILKPRVSEQLDYEGELCVVIGRRGRHIPAAIALEHIAGYTIANDGSVRDWQKRGTQNCPGKNFFRSGAIGPWIVTADEIADPMALGIETRVDGEVRQHGNTAAMLFSIAEAVAHISRFTWLEPGDLIAMGSPGGSAVELDPPAWLRPRQLVEIHIEGIGSLRNSVEAE